MIKTTSIGREAEAAVANYLTSQGFSILERNWRTKVCEIDIVAQKDRVVYLVEVKYRSGSAQGSGFEYIGPQKLRRLKFAAQIWLQHHDWQGDCRLLGAEVDGQTGGIEIIEID